LAASSNVVEVASIDVRREVGGGVGGWGMIEGIFRLRGEVIGDVGFSGRWGTMGVLFYVLLTPSTSQMSAGGTSKAGVAGVW